MKFIEPDFARTANLFLSFEQNDIEILSAEEIEKFHFLLYHFLSRLEYKSGSVKLDRKTKNIKIKLKGYSKNDICIINFNPSEEYGYFSPDITNYDSEDKINNDIIVKIRKYFDKFRFEISVDPLTGVKFKFKKNENA